MIWNKQATIAKERHVKIIFSHITTLPPFQNGAVQFSKSGIMQVERKEEKIRGIQPLYVLIIYISIIVHYTWATVI